MMTLVPNETEQALNRQYDIYEAAREEYRKKIAEQAVEIERLRAGGCARDQGTTQYCAEAAMKDAEIASLLNTLADERTESMRLRAALEWLTGRLEQDFNGGEALHRWELNHARAALEEGRT
jgi:small-conductance mechanosensitive channel